MEHHGRGKPTRGRFRPRLEGGVHFTHEPKNWHREGRTSRRTSRPDSYREIVPSSPRGDPLLPPFFPGEGTVGGLGIRRIAKGGLEGKWARVTRTTSTDVARRMHVARSKREIEDENRKSSVRDGRETVPKRTRSFPVRIRRPWHVRISTSRRSGPEPILPGFLAETTNPIDGTCRSRWSLFRSLKGTFEKNLDRYSLRTRLHGRRKSTGRTTLLALERKAFDE